MKLFKNPFFIIGNPRSGTTLLRLMLNAHPDITVPPECGFALWLAEKYKNYNDYDVFLYKQFASDVLESKKFETWDVAKNDLLDYFEEIKPTQYSDLVDCVYKTYAKKSKKNPSITGDKNNYYINHLYDINKFFPMSKFIYIIRDGRDVACSYNRVNKIGFKSKYKPNLPRGIKNIAVEWKKSCEIIL